jgi:hypothetical protein
MTGCWLGGNIFLVSDSFVNKSEIVSFFSQLHTALAVDDYASSTRSAVALIVEDMQKMEWEVAWERLLECNEVMGHRFNRIHLGWANISMMSLISFAEHQSTKDALEEARALWRSKNYEESGFRVFEAFDSSSQRVKWASNILDSCLSLSKLKQPNPAFSRCLEIARTPARWGEAHDCFSEIRSLVSPTNQLPTGNYIEHVQGIAELVAKVIYNESCSPMPFDRDSGWAIVPAMQRLASEVGGNFALEVEDILFSLVAN